jgi:hypothetical protein
MTGINDRKIIQNLQFVNSFAVPISSRAKESIRLRSFPLFSSLFLVGFKEPDDVSIQAAIALNDKFIDDLQAIHQRAQALTID